MAATAQARAQEQVKAGDLEYSTYYDPALRLWVAVATAPKTSLRALGASKAQALAILWRHVRDTLPPRIDR